MIEKEMIVRMGYNVIAKKYQVRRGIFDNQKALKKFTTRLPQNAKILDVGCGSGIPVTKFLVHSGYQVTGVDFSEAMLKLAQKNVPQASLVQKDMTRLGFKDNSFDGITAIYSLIHVPREHHRLVFHSFHRILKPHGILLVTVGNKEFEAIDKHLGTEMFWSYHSSAKSRRLVTESGFQIICDEPVVLHYWILATNMKRGHE